MKGTGWEMCCRKTKSEFDENLFKLVSQKIMIKDLRRPFYISIGLNILWSEDEAINLRKEQKILVGTGWNKMNPFGFTVPR
jgi:hypothetical protein